MKPGVDPFSVYRALRIVNPSPYLYFLRFDLDKGVDPTCLVGSSPELLVRVQQRHVEYRPIAGTRPRSANEEEDLRIEQELLANEKERAEHVMLVDLGRNDIGRVCEFGSVRVKSLMHVERYSHVMHLVSSLEGQLKEGFLGGGRLLRLLPRRNLERRAQDTRDGDYRGTGADTAGHLRGQRFLR